MTYTIRTHDDRTVLAERGDWFRAAMCAKVHAVLSGYPVTLDSPDGTSDTIYPEEQEQ